MNPSRNVVAAVPVLAGLAVPISTMMCMAATGDSVAGRSATDARSRPAAAVPSIPDLPRAADPNERSVQLADGWRVVCPATRCYVTGELRNASGRQLRTASVAFTLHDARDTKVGDATDLTSGLAAGATWRFRAPVYVPGRVEARPLKVVGY